MTLTTVPLPDGTEVDLALTVIAVRKPGPLLRATTSGTGPVTLPAHQAGDVLVVALAVPSDRNNLTPSGWPVIQNRDTGGAHRGYLFSRVASSAADLPPTFPSPQAIVWQAWAFDRATGVDVSGSANGSTPSPTCVSLDPTTAPTLLLDVVIFNTEDGATTVMMPSGEAATAATTGSDTVTILRSGTLTLASDVPTGARGTTLDAAAANVTLSVVVK